MTEPINILKPVSNIDYSTNLYHMRYAPTKLEDFYGNYGVAQTLMSFLEGENPSLPNLIITGPHGVGKSLLVRLFVKEYLGDEFLKVGSLNIYGSLSRGKDVVSEKQLIKNKQKYFNYSNITTFIKRSTPMPAGMLKIIVIYEFHQMSIEAQMALRRIIELNSHRVRFIFVTQSYHRIIQALQSRCTILHLQKLDKKETTNLMSLICGQEGIEAHEDLFDLIYLHTEGDIRYSVNLLQLLANGDQNPISYYRILGIPEVKTVKQILDHCQAQESLPAYKLLRQLLENGFEICDLLDLLTRVLIDSPDFPQKNQFLSKLGKDTLKIQECYTSTQLFNLVNHFCTTDQQSTVK